MKDTLEQSRPGLVVCVYAAVQHRQFSARTEHLYLHWITRFLVYHDLQDPAGLSQPHISSFLDHLEHQWKLSRARLNQALKALAFLYEEVLKLPQKMLSPDEQPRLTAG